MPTPEEQLVQVEAALRRRFLPLVPKVVTQDRINWTDDQHDIDRLSRALAAYALVGLAEIDDATAAGAVTDGKDDRGIDALYFDKPRARLVIVQAKFKRTGASPSQEEVQKTVSGVKALLARRFDEFNLHFQQRLDEIEEALDTPGVVLEIILVCLGENLGQHATQDLNAFQGELNAGGMTWQLCGRTRIAEWLLAEEAPSSVTVDVTLENWSRVEAPRRAIYGQISARTVAELVTAHGKTLFEKNIRHYLGSVGVNTAIAEAVRRKPQDFFYLNNGLTAVADRIVFAPGTRETCKFRLENVSIVNGAQTAGAITTAAVDGDLSPQAKVFITVIEMGAQQDDIGRRITRARNHQNVVRGVDFAALDPHQEHLRQELAVVGTTYHYRPSAEARARREDAFTLEEAAVALACLSFEVLSNTKVRELRTQGKSVGNAVDFVVMAKKEIGRLWEQEGAAYGQIFRADLSGVRMCRLVHMYRFIDRILASNERAENGYYRRMFFRHGRYFIMAFVAHRLPGVVGGPQLALSEEDKTLLSQRTNELAELIYAQSQPLQATKGYLAIFRNLTDSQPLADGVLGRLAQQDAVAMTPDGAQAPPRAPEQP